MIYTEMTVKAMRLVYEAHQGQVDYNNIPYIYHPIHLAEQMEDEVTCTVALLHDVVEDTAVTFADLEKEFPAEVIEALRLLTHEAGVDYFDYVRKIKTNPIAKRVKLEDLKHNSDESRNVEGIIADERLEFWRKKYAKAKEILLTE